MKALLLQQFQHRQSVAVADCIATVRRCSMFAGCGVSNIAIDKIVHNQLAVQLKLQARKGCPLPHLGVLAFLGDESVVAQITHRTYTVGLPADTQTIADMQIG